jgi:transposase
MLEDLDEEDWRCLVLKRPSDYGYETDLWTVRRLQAVIREVYHVPVSRDTVRRRLRDAGLTYRKPERAYYELDEPSRQKGSARKSRGFAEWSKNTGPFSIFRTNRMSR